MLCSLVLIEWKFYVILEKCLKVHHKQNGSYFYLAYEFINYSSNNLDFKFKQPPREIDIIWNEIQKS